MIKRVWVGLSTKETMYSGKTKLQVNVDELKTPWSSGAQEFEAKNKQNSMQKQLSS